MPNQRREAATADGVEEEEEEEEKSLSTAKQHDIYIQGVCHNVALAIYIKNIFEGKKKNHENSNYYFHHAKI